ncbi:MAG: hypothetical protein RIB84_20965 [Sneathiellaceae bacterium]
MEVESKGQAPVFARTQTARPAADSAVSDKVARSIEQAQVAIDIRTGLADARRGAAERQVANLKEQADKLRVLSVVAPAAFAEYVSGLSRQLSATVSAYADGGDPVAIRQQVRNLAEWVVRLDEQGLGTPAPGKDPEAPEAPAGEATATTATAGTAPEDTEGASWEDLVTEVKAWLADDDARLATERRGWLAARSATPEQAEDRQLVSDARKVQQRLDLLFAVAVSQVEDGEDARNLTRRHGRTSARLDDALGTIDGWARGIASRPPTGGLSILA